MRKNKRGGIGNDTRAERQEGRDWLGDCGSSAVDNIIIIWGKNSHRKKGEEEKNRKHKETGV